MGLYDRDYAREEQGGFAFGADQPMIVTLILVNIVLFLPDWFSGGQISKYLSLQGNAFSHPLQLYRVLTYGFMHASLWHVVINMPLAFAICLAQLGEHQRKVEWAARDLGASTLRVLTAITMPMIAPALIAAFCLCFTLSWDEFIIAFLVTRFDVTLPVVIWTLLRGGLNPQTNAVGSFIFMCSILMLIAVELLLFRKRTT